jgi:HSP20 family protein
VQSSQARPRGNSPGRGTASRGGTYRLWPRGHRGEDSHGSRVNFDLVPGETWAREPSVASDPVGIRRGERVMVMRFDRFREIEGLMEEMQAGRRAPRLLMDAYRRGDDFIVHFDLPGIDADSIDLTTEENVLTVSAQRTYEPEEGDEILVSERPQGKFSRQLFLGEGLDREAITASYDQGVLTVKVPRAERAKPRRIEISGGGSPQVIEAETA